MITLLEALGSVYVYGLYLMGIVLCCLAAKLTFVSAKDFSAVIKSARDMGQSIIMLFCYIFRVVLGGWFPDDPLYLTL